MNYYIEDNGKIVLFDENKQQLEQTVTIFMPQYVGLPILETEREIIELNNEFVFKDEAETELAQARQAKFEKQFFNIEGVGHYRRQPKGYSSALESVNTAFNAVTIMGVLPANTLTFYKAPDFKIEEQCTEEWLVANSFKNSVMTAQEFGQFYASFITAWNEQEHL